MKLRPALLTVLAVLAVVSTHLHAAEPGETRHDVVIYGGTSAGVTAAVQAATMGKTVVLIEPTRHLGGLSSAGLGMTDTGNKEVIGGLARDFYRRVKRHYADDAAWKWEKRADYRHYSETADALWRFEPAVAERIFRQMLAGVKVDVVEGERLDLRDWGRKEGAEIRTIRMESGRTFAGSRFIDATYEGDLMAKAGVSHHVGREANATYGETLNGVQLAEATKHQFLLPVDPWVTPGDRSSGLLPGVQAEAPGVQGEGDRRIQAYCFRLALTDVPENRIPFPKPAAYDPQRYELLRRYLAAGWKWKEMWNGHHMMPNRKSDTNNSGGFSSDHIGANYAYPEGDYATRERIVRDHEDYQKGMWYFLANDPGVPADVRAEVARWGLPKDEFTATGGWPHALYIREARRMVGEWVHTEHDCRRTRETPLSVGMGSYNMDSHHVQRFVDEKGNARNEGDVQRSPGGPYPISYLSLVPRATECTNLLVPVCVSSSHIAYGSIRMEPVFMILGQSAATAACLSLDAGTTVQKVPAEALRQRLLADGQVLDFARPASSGGRAVTSLPGVVADDAQAAFSGDWTASSSIGGHVGAGYRHTLSLQARATFTLRVPSTGKWQLRLWWTAAGNRSGAAPVRVTTAGRELAALTVDQRRPAGEKGHAVPGNWQLSAGDTVEVVLSGAAGGHVIADAVQLVPSE